MTNLLKHIKEGNNEIFLDEKMLYWHYFEKYFVFLSKKHEFSFPLRQISSIRFFNERNIKWKSILWWIIRSIIGFITLIYFIWILFLAYGIYLIYETFKPLSWIQIMVNWWDKELFVLKWKNVKEAKDFVLLANEYISKI